MIYTIKCRRGHCGARHQIECEDHSDVAAYAVQLRTQMELHGWVKDSGGSYGWLCPFDAQKEASSRRTCCHGEACLNQCRAFNVRALERNGWHGLPSEPSGPIHWYCPACWKTTQPEPAPYPASPLAAFPPWSIDEVKEIAAQVAYDMIDKVITDAERINVRDNSTGQLGLWESFKLAVAMQRPERTNNADLGRCDASQPETGSPGPAATEPESEHQSAAPGPALRDEMPF